MGVGWSEAVKVADVKGRPGKDRVAVSAVGVHVALVILSFVIAFTTTALLRLAGAAEQENDTMEHLVDLEREALPVPRAEQVEHSDIKLE